MAIEAYFFLACIPKSSSLYPLPSSKATSIFSGIFFLQQQPTSWFQNLSARAAITKYHRLCGSSNNNLLSHNSGSWEDQSESSLPSLQMVTFSVSSHGLSLVSEERGRWNSLVFLLIRILTLPDQGPTLTTSVQFSRSVMSNSLQPHEPQHARPPCPSPAPGVYPNSCPSSQWHHPAISSSVIPFSSCPQSLPYYLI